jgi:hypothetical protein
VANCTYTDVRRIIISKLQDADITALIVDSDAEITRRSLTDLPLDIRKRVSMYLTAEVIAAHDLGQVSTSGSSSVPGETSAGWRKKAEDLILAVQKADQDTQNWLRAFA